ncbi:MAG: GDP-L-fucose synthase [Clostridia bacterium]|nr:GDP-L-fucose synthase [Clostridia bacterium]
MEKADRIYIAGHTGLFGNATYNYLNDLGYKNIVTRTHKDLDLTIQQDVRTFFQEERPEYVFVMCGLVGGIEANRTNMAEFTIENLKMNTNIIEAAHNAGVKKLLYLGSSCMYPKHSKQPVKEEYLLQGDIEPTNEGYALAKLLGLKLCQYYKRQYGDNFISCIPSNVYGPGDNFDDKSNHVIPALIKRFHNAKNNNHARVEIWGSGRPQREFLYIDDAVRACVHLMNTYNGESPVNIGTGLLTDVRTLAETIASAVGYNGELYFDTSKPDGMMVRMLESSRISELGWKTEFSLRQGIENTYRWYLENKENSDD